MANAETIVIAGKTYTLKFGVSARTAVERLVGNPIAAAGVDGKILPVIMALLSCGTKHDRSVILTEKKIAEYLDQHFAQDENENEFTVVSKLLQAYARSLPGKRGQQTLAALEEIVSMWLDSGDLDEGDDEGKLDSGESSGATG